MDIDKITKICNTLIDKSIKNLTYFSTNQLKIVLSLIQDQSNIYYYKYKYIEYMLLYDIIYNSIYEIPLHKGGSYKLNKYKNRLNNNNNNNIYELKYQYYLKLYNSNQIGGNDYNSTQLLNNISKICIDDNNITQFLDEKVCSSIDNSRHIDEVDDSNDIINDFTCIPVDIIDIKDKTKNNNYHINYNKYLLKRLFKSISTDQFMKELSENDKLYNKIFNYIFCELNLHLSFFIYEYSVKNNLKLNTEHIILLYKGGNTTRLLLRLLFEGTIESTMRDIILDSIKDTKIGDWDFYVYINYNKIKTDFEYTDDKCLNLKNKIIKIIALALHNIQRNLIHVLETFVYDNFILKCNTDLGTPNIKKSINEHIAAINPYMREKIISIDQIEFIHHKDIINKSFIVTKEKTNTNNRIINKMNNLLDQNDKIPKPKSHIVYIDQIDGITFKGNIDFTLFRYKLNNNMKYTITYEGGMTNQKEVNTSVELIDVSIVNINDKKHYIFTDLFNIIYPEINKYVDIKFDIIVDYSILVTIPSSEYMIVDILLMLYTEKMFPWFDLKYGKRIERIFLLNASITEPTFFNNINKESINFIKKIYETLYEKDKTDIQNRKSSWMNTLIVNLDHRYDRIYESININFNNKELTDIEHLYLFICFLFSKNCKIDQNTYHLKIIKFDNYSSDITIEYLKKLYLAFKINLSVIQIHSFEYIKLLNHFNKNNLFNFIISNIFEIIIFILYLNDPKQLDKDHELFCDKYFEIYKKCDNNDCKGISGEIYSFKKIKDNNKKEIYLKNFIDYIAKLIELSSKMSKMTRFKFDEKISTITLA